jgi:PAS domain S-box-containing protein
MRAYVAGETKSYECEFRMQAKDGSSRWIFARGRFVSDDLDPARRRIIGTHTDITARKLVEEEKADALQFMKTVLSHSPSGIIVYRADGPAVMGNESAARIVGTDVPGILRQNFRDLASWRNSGLLADADQALATGQPVVRIQPTCSSFGRSLWLETHMVPFNFAGDKHLVLVVADQTESHELLAKLQVVQQAIQASPSGWVVTDAEGRIQSVNPGFTRMTGYTAADAIGQTPRILKSDRQTPEFYDAMWRKISAGEFWSGRVINRRKNGTLYHEHNTITPVRDDEGRITHYVSVKHDITEQDQMESRLARTQRLESIGLMAAGVVHDLNNMLSPIMLALGLLRMRHEDAETRTQLKMMESAAQRGAGVLRQVLTFARGVEGEMALLTPKHLLEEIAQLATETFPREIRVAMALRAGTYSVNADLTQIHQVLLNLAVNARDAMPGGGVLTLHAGNVLVDADRAGRQVTAVKPGTYVCLGVRDTGTGIPPEVLEHIFEPFYTTKPRDKGTGLGLSTVFGIVRSHGGFIEVDTEPGRGTDIQVMLPAAGSPVADSVTVAKAVPLEGRGRRILFVDDELAVRTIAAQVLTKRGFDVVVAADGEDGLAKFRDSSAPFAVVILDLMMPRMDGYRLADEIRRIAPTVPIIASTGMSGNTPTEESETLLRAQNVTTILRKPFPEEHLLEMLQRELDRETESAPGFPG